MATQTIQLNGFQQSLLSVPESFDVFCGGGRGGGKSYGLAFIALRHAEQYKERARILNLRKTYKGLADFELVTREVFGMVYGTGARYNATEHCWRFPNGAYIELGQLESYADYAKYQGRSFTLLIVDEAGQYSDSSLLDMMRSNLRGAKDIPIRMIIAGNPGGVGHHWLAACYVFRAAPWEPFYEPKSKRQWVYAPSTFEGNTFIDREQYLEQLDAACADDLELLRAWTSGDWSVVRGAYFASCLSEERNAVDPWDCIPDGWEAYLAHDFGSSAPSCTFICAKSPGATVNGRYFPRDSIVLVDELATVRKDNLNVGFGWNVAVLGEAIRRELCDRWKVAPCGVADDAIFARAGSIADEFRAARVFFVFDPAKKADRVTGWQRMKRLLADAGKPDVPGLYVSRACAYWWATVPTLARDPKRIEDVDSTGLDHAADACRYGLLAQTWAKEIQVNWPTS